MATVPQNVLNWLGYTNGTTSSLRYRGYGSTSPVGVAGPTGMAYCYSPSGTSEGLRSSNGLLNGILVASANRFSTGTFPNFTITFPTWPEPPTTATAYTFPPYFPPISNDYMIIPAISTDESTRIYNFYNNTNNSISAGPQQQIMVSLPTFIANYSGTFAVPGSSRVWATAFIWPLDGSVYNAGTCSSGQYPLPLASYNSDGSITPYTQTVFPPTTKPPPPGPNPIPISPYTYDALIGISILAGFVILILILIIIKANSSK